MKHFYHLTRVSGNSKTGPIPVSTTSRSTCPVSCPLKGNGCYADYGPLALHWNAVSDGKRGYGLDRFCTEIKSLPPWQLWRYGQAGDLPGDGEYIDTEALDKIVKANGHRRGFAYTHYSPLVPANARAIAKANAEGFTINLSANTLPQADEFSRLKVAPVVTILPPGQEKPSVTNDERFVAVCPASKPDAWVNCSTCGICANPRRRSIIGFPAHGSGAEKAHRVFWAQRDM